MKAKGLGRECEGERLTGDCGALGSGNVAAASNLS